MGLIQPNMPASTPQPSGVSFPEWVGKIETTKADLTYVNTLVTPKADKAYVDIQLSSVNGGPKGTYATVAALQSAFPSGTNSIYLVSADGKWYFWNGSAWTAGGIYQGTDWAEGVASRTDSNGNIFTTIGSRLDNYDTVVKNGLTQKLINDWVYGSLDFATGNETSSGSIIRSGFQTYGAGTVLTISMTNSHQVLVLEYDESNVFKKYTTWISGDASLTLTYPNVRFAVRLQAGSVVLGEANLRCRLFLPTLLKTINDTLTKKADLSAIYTINLGLGTPVANTYMYAGSPLSDTFSVGISSTDYIEVIPGYTVKLEKVRLSGNVAICYYDSAKSYLGDINKQGMTSQVATIEFVIPAQAAFIRFSYTTTNEATVKCYYSGSSQPYKWESAYKGDPTIKSMQDKAALSFSNFLKAAGQTPIATWVDDDTSVSKIPNVKTICDALGIKATFACITNLLSDATLLSLLQGYQRAGFHITTHSETHGDMWNTGGANYNPASCEIELINSINTLRSYGFLDCDHLITPFGVSTPEIQTIARKWAKSLVRAHAGSDNHLYGDGRYTIKRLFIRPSTGDLNYFKSRIDAAVAGGDWIIFGTHSGIPAEWDETLITGVLQYAQSKGMAFMTLNEAMNRRKYVYDMYEIFG